MCRMVKEGDRSSGGGPRSSEQAQGSRSWTRVIQGTVRGPSWTSQRITEGEINELQSYFSKVLELPEEMMEESRKHWEKLAVFTRSLGWRVLADWVAKEVKQRFKLENDPKVFSIANTTLFFDSSRRWSVWQRSKVARGSWQANCWRCRPGNRISCQVGG